MRSQAEFDVLFKQNFGIIAIIKFEWVVTGAGILGIIVSKLNYWQQLYLIVLLLINKYSKVYFYCYILSLCLAICSEVKNYT